MTIFVIWQSIVTLDSILNSCDAYDICAQCSSTDSFYITLTQIAGVTCSVQNIISISQLPWYTVTLKKLWHHLWTAPKKSTFVPLSWASFKCDWLHQIEIGLFFSFERKCHDFSHWMVALWWNIGFYSSHLITSLTLRQYLLPPFESKCQCQWFPSLNGGFHVAQPGSSLL